MGYTVLIFEDDMIISRSLLVNIDWGRFHITNHLTAAKVSDGCLLFEGNKIDLVLCDIEVIGGTGLDLLKWSKANGYETEFIFLTNYAEFSYAQEVIQFGGNDYILKTEPLDAVEDAVERAITRIEHKLSGNQTVLPKQPVISDDKADASEVRWKEWERFLFYAEKLKLLDAVKTFFEEARGKSKIDLEFLTSFQNKFIQMMQKTLIELDIQEETLLDKHLVDLYRNSTVSVFDMIKWLSYYVDRFIMYLEEKNSGGKLIKQVKSFIKENYARDISRQDIASAVNVNADYLSRLFNKQVGVSIPEYIAGIRMERAKQLMSTELTISEIAVKVGFYNFSYFSRIFKKYTGVSPSEYKK